jgi:CheY-like chemotaxis protein
METSAFRAPARSLPGVNSIPIRSLPMGGGEGMKKILLIEDDLVVRTVYRRFLQWHGFKVETAVDGEEGLAKLSAFQPDAVLLDVMMPKLDGITVLQVMRVQEAFQSLPVIVLTNAAIPAFIELACEAGADHVFDKSKDSPVAVVGMLKRLLDSTWEPQQTMTGRDRTRQPLSRR